MIKNLLMLTKKTIKKLHYPAIYSYPRYILYDFIAGLGGYKKEGRLKEINGLKNLFSI